MTMTPSNLRELVERLRGHALGLKVNARYDDGAPSGLTNADAVSYGELLDIAADRIEELEAGLRVALSDLNTPGHLGGPKTNRIARNLRALIGEGK